MSDHVCPWSKFNHECQHQCDDLDEEDPQKERVYCFEEMLHDQLDLDENMLSLSTCRHMIEDICFRHAVTPPVVVDGRGLRTARGGAMKISLPKKYREPISVVHEACHVLVYYHDPEAESHGPEFVRYMISALPIYIKGYSKARLEREMTQFGLLVASKDACRPPPYYLVRPLIEKVQVIRGYHLASQEAADRSIQMRAKQSSKIRGLNPLLRQVQVKARPEGIPHEMEKILEKTSLGLAHL